MRYSRPKALRWSVYLRGGLLGQVLADNWPAACRRAMQRWRIAPEDQKELMVESAGDGPPR
jgi:hypothetical protein